MKLLNRQDVENLLVGAEILGCGGGGQIEWGRKLVEEVYDEGKRFRLLDLNELPDDKLVFIVGGVGGGVGREMEQKLASRLKMLTEEEKMCLPLLAAKRELVMYLQEDAYALVPSEIGAGNTLAPMHIAAMEEKAIVDGNACGRAKPEIALSTTHVAGIPIIPLTIVSPLGDVAILRKAIDDYRAEDICRYTAIVSGGFCGVARSPAGERLQEGHCS